jgi:urease accessory protein
LKAAVLTAGNRSQAGWQASLDLTFGRGPAGTKLTRNLHRGPLQVQKALYPEGPDTCHVVVLHPPGGIAAGDSLAVRASLEDGASALLTTPGANKWYRSTGPVARQSQHFALAADAVLEWLPRENILFDRSAIAMDLDVALSAGARYFGWEVLCFGRRASGESWRSGTFATRTCVRLAGRTLWSEVGHVDAGSGFTQSPVGLAGRAVSGTFLVAGADVDDELLRTCRRQTTRGAALTGLTRVPGVLLARYLGDSCEEVLDYFTVLWTVLRPALAARQACAPRVWAC